MEPDKVGSPNAHRDEFAVASFARGLARPFQRKLAPQQMEASGSASHSAHGEDSSFDSHASPPQHDRAG